MPLHEGRLLIGIECPKVNSAHCGARRHSRRSEFLVRSRLAYVKCTCPVPYKGMNRVSQHAGRGLCGAANGGGLLRYYHQEAACIVGSDWRTIEKMTFRG